MLIAAIVQQIAMECGTVSKQNHHERQELCMNRPKYRQGRKLTAVKVFKLVNYLLKKVNFNWLNLSRCSLYVMNLDTC